VVVDVCNGNQCNSLWLLFTMYVALYGETRQCIYNYQLISNPLESRIYYTWTLS